ncbi:transcriptional elongation regulator MINIYO isoform X1 [Salvia hispanica]|uniref:transcriptional elongation regulator MINIYO isoform X1 n=1 Tax=Salvia hispanica TaxID=49212 RepID=UPI002009DB33|nr:transcriptional elongation regulator MINIYO isoform X1 [Salvia hispanica]XP_047945468.1 transcriptional elongation regulator MINIYO isoform X1 [Salvia hispanica]
MREYASRESKNLKSKMLGATSIQIGEDDVSRLVGGIVEKGFSEARQTRPLPPPTGPRPTVLPFPLARHRSHGPHWAPNVGNSNGKDSEDELAGEEEDFEGRAVAAAANPLQRKEKRGLDFSRWREMAKKAGSSGFHEKEEGWCSNGDEVEPKETKMASNGDAQFQSMTMTSNVSTIREAKGEAKDASHLASDKEFYSSEYGKNGNNVQTMQYQQDGIAESDGNTVVEKASTWQNGLRKEVDLKRENMPKPHTASVFSGQASVGGEESSLQSQIDAENRARIANMSADELAEAQAEIMAKLNPKLIDALKKRGQGKDKRQKSYETDVTGSASVDMQHEEALPKISGNTVSHEPMEIETESTLKDKEDNVSTNASPDKGSIWNAWSKRVERVRDVRFSLDGNIIGFGMESNIGQFNSNNVSQRDYLRTEGDPGAGGYTIKEALALARSVVPGQRTLALSVIAAILNRAISKIIQNQVDSVSNIADSVEPADWVAIWAYALGPEPELALLLRISFDDNHNSVVLNCAKAILSALSYDTNKILFDMLERTPTYSKDVSTAPVFRSKPDVNVGFLRGGFWKYNTKPSNILRCGEEMMDDEAEGEGEHTIQDDVVVAGQDFAAGLVRMGTLERICYLLQTDPAAPLEECLISILIALARHSPTCAAAVLDCGRLVQTIAGRFTSNEQMEINGSKIKSVTLFKVLAQHGRKNCSTFINNGIFRQLTWHLYRYPFSLDLWVKSGRESCILSSAMLVEQLRLWKVSVNYGYSISDFSDLFTSLCAWLSVPTFEKLSSYDVMSEYCAITREAYLLLGVMANRLPNFYSSMQEPPADTVQDTDPWSWRHFGPIIDSAVEWIQVKNIAFVSRLFNSQSNDGERICFQDSKVNSLLWIISSVLSMLASVLKAVIPEDFTSLPDGRLPWLPEFVPKIGLAFVKNGYIRSGGSSDPSENGSFVKYLCDLRLQGSPEFAISSQCCLQGFFQIADSVDKLVTHANLDIHSARVGYNNFSRDDKILANGILKSCSTEIQYLLSTSMEAITSDWQFLRPIEMFSRGGPAPGVGVGWGASAGGYWSLNSLLAQQDAGLLVYLLEAFGIPSTVDPSEAEEMDCTMQKIECILTACLIVGPWSSSVLDKLLKIIFQVPVLKHLSYGIHKFLSLRKGYSSFKWNYDDEEYALISNVLASHFRTRWLGAKKKRKAMPETNHPSQKSTKKKVRFMETIHEDMNATSEAGEVMSSSSSLILEWARQRLPLPEHWFLSAISTIQLNNNTCPPSASHGEIFSEVASDIVEVAKSGLFFLLAIEAIPTSLSSEFRSPAKCVPVVWKLHAMSATLLSGMGVLEDEKSRTVYETLQNVYGGVLDEKRSSDVLGHTGVERLKFASDIHDSYPTFIETLVEQFSAESYGDVIFGRQVAMYLHKSVEDSARLAAWNTLSNARVLELLPPLHKCLAKADGYLEPIEDNESILEAYVKSWTSGALDKAANRGSVAFSLVLHHLSSFIFGSAGDATLSLRNKLAKSLMRDYSRRQQHEGMMVKLICDKKPEPEPQASATAASSLPMSAIEKRLQLLTKICDGCAPQVAKLEACIRKERSE